MRFARLSSLTLLLLLACILLSCNSSSSSLTPPVDGPGDVSGADGSGGGGNNSGDSGDSGGILHHVIMRPQDALKQGPKGVSLADPLSILNQMAPPDPDKQASCEGGGVFMEGGGFEDDPPPVNVTRTGEENTEGLYSPNYIVNDLYTTAHAYYRWNLRGFIGLQTFGFTWVEGEQPANWLDFWIGLGDLGTNSWDWYKGPEDNVLTIDSFGPYRSATGEVLMVVVLLGSEDATLAYMEAGVPETRATGAEGLPEGAPSYPLLGGAGSLPASFDLSAECAPINDQLTWGSCTAFAVGDGAYNYELGVVYGALGWNLNNDFFRVSPKHLYIVSGELQGFPPGGGTGRWTESVGDDLQDHGVATELNAPYDLIYDNNWTPAALADAAVLTIEDWQEVPCNTWEGIATVKTVLALQRKVLPMQAYLDTSFFNYQAGQVWYPLGSFAGGHAMCIVGYDDTRGSSGAFKVRNSWSDYWGDDGYVWIGYEAFLAPSAAIRAWTLTEEYSADVIEHFGINPPGQPPVTRLRASDGTNENGIELTWDARPGTTAYTVYRDVSTNNVAQVTEANWLDTSIADSYGHTYWVRSDSSALSAPDVGYRASTPQIDSVNPTEAIEGDEITFSAAGLGSAPLDYSWNFGGGAVPNTSTDPQPTVTIGTPGTYNASLTLENSLGSDTFNFDLEISGLPPVIHFISGESGYSGDSITLSADIGGTPSSYQWNLGGGATPNNPTAAEPNVTLGAPGLYEASLSVDNDFSSDIFYFILAVLDDSDTDWNMAGHDNRNSGVSPVTGPQTSNVKWKLYLGGPEFHQTSNHLSNPLVLADGDIIVANDRSALDTSLWRLNSNGSPQWMDRRDVNADYGQPVLSPEGDTVYVMIGRSITALNADTGQEKWTATPSGSDEGQHYNQILVAPDGLLYVHLTGKWLTALNPADGSEAFTPFAITDRYNKAGLGLLSPDGTLFTRGLINYDNLMVGFDTIAQAPAGSLRVPEPVAGMSLSADGLTLFMADADGVTFAFDTATCQQLWKQTGTIGPFFSDNRNAPCVLPNGDVVMANQGGKICWLDADTGEIYDQYDLNLEEDCYSRPAFGRDGTVYVGGSNKKLYALRDGGLLWESADANSWYFTGSPALGPDGTLYCGSEDGWLWAFGTGGTGESYIPALISEVTPVEGDEGEAVTFNATVYGTAPLTYAWDFGGAATPNTSTDASPTVTLGTVGTYTASLTLSNTYGNWVYPFDLRVFYVSGNTPPTAILSADPESGAAPLDVSFDASLSHDDEGPISLYEWAPAGDHHYDDLLPNSETLDYTYTLAGTYEVWVRVTDLDGATDETSVTISVTSDQSWHIVTAVSDGNSGNFPSLLEVDGRPAISYVYNTDIDEQRYVRAVDAYGTAWGTPVTIAAGNAGYWGSMALIDGNPAVAYYTKAGVIYFARSTDSTGASWATPVSLVDLATNVKQGCSASLAEVQSRPAIAYYDHSGYGKPAYLRANDSSGSSWPASAIYPDSNSNDVGKFIRLIVADGNPAIGYWDADAQDVYFTRATSTDGASWGTPQMVDGGGFGGPSVGEWCRLVQIDGNPALTYWSVEGTHYVRATNAAGSAWGTVNLMGIAKPSKAIFTGGQVFGAMLSGSYADLFVRRTTQLDGSSWNPSEYLVESKDMSALIDAEVINGAPAVVWFESGTSDLMYAIYN